MVHIVNKQRFLAFVLAALLYIAVIAGVGFYLLVHGENTVQRRLQMTPHADIALFDETVEEAPQADMTETVPDSWQDDVVTDDMVADDAAEDAAQNTVSDVEQPVQENEPEQVETPLTPEAEKPVVEQNDTQTDTVVEPTVPAVSVNPDAVPVAVQQQDNHVPVWKRYARPFNANEKRPRIALIVSDLGLARNATDVAVQDLPGEVTLAFSSLVPDLDSWFAKARAAGHEILLTIPMEPNNYPQNDPGPNALLLTLDDAENLVRLKRALDRIQGFIGITPYMGDKFVTSEAKMTPVMQMLRDKELLVLDHSLNGSSVIAPLARLGKMPFSRVDLKIDAAANINSVDEQLANLEKIAKEHGSAVGIALPYPVTFERLKLWIAGLDKKGIALAPLSALVTIEPSPVQVVDTPAAQ